MSAGRLYKFTVHIKSCGKTWHETSYATAPTFARAMIMLGSKVTGTTRRKGCEVVKAEVEHG